MRLVCPNCDARYEVPDDAIPEGGRDVQCSGCGHAWFQPRPETEIAAEEEAVLFGDDLPLPEPIPAGGGAAGVADDLDPASQDAAEQTDEAISAILTQEQSDAEAPAQMDARKQELDDNVLAVLREEAERETEARRAEAQREGAKRAEAEGQMQVQTDLGLEATAAALSPTQRRLAMLKGKDPDAPPPPPARPAARRDLLPDVEEINSTLQPSEAMSDPDAEVDALPDLTRRRSGFRSGFFLMILLLLIAAAVYVAAPRITAHFPALEGPMAGYVTAVDDLRTWLNNLVNRTADALKGTEP